MSTPIQDLDDVRALIQLYIDGSNGDVSKLQQAFHPAARMAGHFGTDVDDNVPIGNYFSEVAAQPELAEASFRTVLRTIDICGDAGVVVLVLSGYLGCDFVDYLSVARFDGRWQITNKTYAHTGGEPPAG
jgi:hypothetical protein